MFDTGPDADTARSHLHKYSKRATRPVTHFVSAQPAATGQRVRIFPGSREQETSTFDNSCGTRGNFFTSSSGTTKYIQMYLHTALSYGKVEWANLEGHLNFEGLTTRFHPMDTGAKLR